MHFRLPIGLVCVGLVWFVFFAPSNNTVIKLLAGVLDRIHSILFLCLFWQFKSCFCIVWFCFATRLNIFSYVYSSVFIFFFMSCLSILLSFSFFSSDICRNYLDIRNINSLFVTNIGIFPPAYKWSQFFLMLFSNKEIFINMYSNLPILFCVVLGFPAHSEYLSHPKFIKTFFPKVLNDFIVFLFTFDSLINLEYILNKL